MSLFLRLHSGFFEGGVSTFRGKRYHLPTDCEGFAQTCLPRYRFFKTKDEIGLGFLWPWRNFGAPAASDLVLRVQLGGKAGAEKVEVARQRQRQREVQRQRESGESGRVWEEARGCLTRGHAAA